MTIGEWMQKHGLGHYLSQDVAGKLCARPEDIVEQAPDWPEWEIESYCGQGFLALLQPFVEMQQAKFPDGVQLLSNPHDLQEIWARLLACIDTHAFG